MAQKKRCKLCHNLPSPVETARCDAALRRVESRLLQARDLPLLSVERLRRLHSELAAAKQGSLCPKCFEAREKWEIE